MAMDGARSSMMVSGKSLSHLLSFFGYAWVLMLFVDSIAYMINENSIQFNIVSKGLGSERMQYYLGEAASDIRDLMTPTLEAPKAKL